MGTEKWGITRQAALDLMEQYLEAENLRKHSVATEAIMRSLAPMFNEDPEMWGISGLLHDLDYNETREAMDKHGLVTERILLQKGVHPDIIEAIKFHNADHLGLTATKPIHFALSAAETITGMIVATTLVYPDKMLSSVKAKSVRKRMGAKEFARAVNRDRIHLCEKINIPLDEFISISIEAMKRISSRLGL
jgi:putative nucleotidyltransferase with HDIG domain